MLRSFWTLTSWLVAFAVLSTACSRNSKTDTPEHALAHLSEEGGIDGGGGGTLPANPIGIEDAFQIIQTAKDDLLPVLKYHTYIVDLTHPSSIYKKIFLGKPTIFDVLYTTNIEIPMDRPCKDSTGRDVDGSVHASKPGTICISAFRIAPKLIKERARTEILALIAHELSHLLGCNEAEARELQADLADDLRQITPKPHFETFNALALAYSETADQRLSSVVRGFDKASIAELFQLMWTAEAAIREFESKARDIPQSALTNKEYTYFNLQQLRFQLATDWIRSQPGMPNAGEFKADYDKVFGGNDEVTYGQYLIDNNYRSVFDVTDYDGERIQRLQNSAQLKQLIADLAEYMSALSQSMRQVSFGSRPNHLPEPTAPVSPWAAFAGDYEVVSSYCTPGNVHQANTGYSISPAANRPGKYRLVQHWQNGYGDQGGLEDGTDVVSGGAAVFVSGGPDWAERQYETFDRWGNRGGQDFTQNVVRLEKTAAGYSLTETTHWIQWRHHLAQESETSCTFILKKK